MSCVFICSHITSPYALQHHVSIFPSPWCDSMPGERPVCPCQCPQASKSQQNTTQTKWHQRGHGLLHLCHARREHEIIRDAGISAEPLPFIGISEGTRGKGEGRGGEGWRGRRMCVFMKNTFACKSVSCLVIRARC